MPDNLRPTAQLLGRILLSLVFLLNGIAKITDFAGTTQYMASRPFFGAMAGAIPAFAVMAIVAEVGGGLGILLGIRARLVAFLLAVFLLATTFIFHNFWTYPEQQAQMQMANFLKNLAIIGGLLMIAADGAGAYSIDARAR